MIDTGIFKSGFRVTSCEGGSFVVTETRRLSVVDVAVTEFAVVPAARSCTFTTIADLMRWLQEQANPLVVVQAPSAGPAGQEVCAPRARAFRSPDTIEVA